MQHSVASQLLGLLAVGTLLFALCLRRLAEKKARDHAGFSFVFKGRRQAHSRTM
jgi:hypothetical protein